MENLVFSLTHEAVQAWSKGGLEDWATESLAEARLAYRLPGTDRLMESGTKLGEEYCRFALPIIQRRLAQAGIRVAFTLNAIFNWLLRSLLRDRTPPRWLDEGRKDETLILCLQVRAVPAASHPLSNPGN